MNSTGNGDNYVCRVAGSLQYVIFLPIYLYVSGAGMFVNCIVLCTRLNYKFSEPKWSHTLLNLLQDPWFLLLRIPGNALP